MTARRTVVGLTVLCALMFSAFAAANASAKGTTGYTCAKTGTTTKIGEFPTADCQTEGPGEYHHFEIASGTKTTLQSTDVTPFQLNGTPGGIEAQIQATGVVTTGTIENVNTTPMKFVSEEEIEFTGATVTKPAGKGCVVKGGVVKTKPLTNESIIGETATTTGVLFKPASGTTFAEITLEGCSVSGLNKTFPVTGTAVGTPKGTILTFTEGSTKPLLKFGGNTAYLTGSATISGRAVGSTGAFTGLSVTTTAS